MKAGTFKHTEEHKAYMSAHMKEYLARHPRKGLAGASNPATRPEVREKIGNANRGRVRTESAKKQTSATLLEGYASGRLNSLITISGKPRIYRSNKGKKIDKLTGPNNANWKGGITPESEKIRKSDAYVCWAKQVKERDNWTCQECHKRGGNMHADHIKPFWLYPELRLELSNGRTLCEKCHRKTDTYGRKALKYQIPFEDDWGASLIWI